MKVKEQDFVKENRSKSDVIYDMCINQSSLVMVVKLQIG